MAQANCCLEIFLIASYGFAHKFQLCPDVRNSAVPVDGSSVSLLQPTLERKKKNLKLIDREMEQKIIGL